MATTRNGWTITHDGTTGNYTLEKSITDNGDQTILVKCGNKAMSGNLRVNVGVSVPTGITPTGTITLTQQNGTDVTNYASANVRTATYGATLSKTLSGTQVIVTPSVSVSQSGWVQSGKTGTSVVINATDFGSGVITPSIGNSGLDTYFDNGTSTTYSVALTPQYINSAGYVSAHATAQSGTIIYKKIKQGTEGSPIAEKGAVSGNKVVITPKVTNVGGWIAGGTISGTAITVTADELVSGTLSISSSGTKDCKTYASVNIRNATVSMPSSLSGTSATVSLNGTSITLTKAVTNSANFTQSGWLSSLSGTTTLTLEGEVPTESKTVIPTNEEQTITPSNGKLLSSVIVNAAPTYKKVEVEASSSQIYKIIGECSIIPINSSEGAGATISNTYFKITSISTSYLTSGVYQTTVTYQTMANSSSSDTPSWDSHTVTTQGTLSSVTKCLIKFELGQAVISKCSSTPTKISSTLYTTVTSGTTTYSLIYDIDVKNELCYYELYVSCSSSSSYKCLFYPYFSIAGANNSKPTQTAARSTMSINYRYSTNGTSYSNGSCSATASSSGQYTGSYSIKACYYPTTEYL